MVEARRGLGAFVAVVASIGVGVGCDGARTLNAADSGQSGPGSGGAGGGGVDGGTIDGGALIAGSPIATFDVSTDGFALNTYHDSGLLNLGDPTAGVSPTATLAFDGTQGSPTAGSLKVTAPYSGARQYVDVQKVLGPASSQDWTGRTLRVRIRTSQGTFRGTAEVYVATTAAYVFGGTNTHLALTPDWQEVTLDVSHPMTEISGYDPTRVVALGVVLNSDVLGADQLPVTFSIDDFSLEPPLAASGTARP